MPRSGRVALTVDLPAEDIRRSDGATVGEHPAVPDA